MLGFKPRISGVGSYHSANCATTTAHKLDIVEWVSCASYHQGRFQAVGELVHHANLIPSFEKNGLDFSKKPNCQVKLNLWCSEKGLHSNNNLSSYFSNPEVNGLVVNRVGS